VRPSHILILDIDALRPDVFKGALEAGGIPNIARLLGGSAMGRGVQLPMVSSAPSITFCAQASLFTGRHPKEHGVPGCQFFDRFGSLNEGVARFLGFDVGEALAVDDAVRTFTAGLADRYLRAPTIYEQLAEQGWRGVVAGHMYARGAEAWLKPSLVQLARLTRGGGLLGISAADYDRHVLHRLLNHLGEQGLAEGTILTMYFLGLDHESHARGPGSQADYLTQQVDPMVGELWQAIEAAAPGTVPLVVICSDHGQIEVPSEDQFALRLGFLVERELGHFFDALGLDVNDYPGEDPHCDAVMALNGGLAYVYLKRGGGQWAEAPDFERDVLPVGRAFWEAHETGRYCVDLRGALAGVLLRDVAREGWEAGYRALTPAGVLVPLEAWFGAQPAGLYIDPVHRLNNLAGPFTGDIVLLSNYSSGYYFCQEISGVHGGLHPEDSCAMLAYGWPGATAEQWGAARAAIEGAIAGRCRAEGGRQVSAADMLTGVEAVVGR
jgi:hypothetical protein